MLRSSFLYERNIKYDNNYLHIEDFKLWIQISRISKLKIIPETLVRIRKHQNQIGNINFFYQNNIVYKIINEQLNELGIEVQEIKFYRNYLEKNYPVDNFNYVLIDSFKLIDFFNKIIEANHINKLFDEVILTNFFFKRAWNIACHSTPLGYNFYKFYVSRFKINSIYLKLKFLIKCLIRKNL